jgi:hypothetical protein
LTFGHRKKSHESVLPSGRDAFVAAFKQSCCEVLRYAGFLAYMYIDVFLTQRQSIVKEFTGTKSVFGDSRIVPQSRLFSPPAKTPCFDKRLGVATVQE